MAGKKYTQRKGNTIFGNREQERGHIGKARLARPEHEKVVVFDMKRVDALPPEERRVFDECMARGRKIPGKIMEKVARVESAERLIKERHREKND